MPEILGNTLNVFLETAPWLLLGLVMAGLIRAWLPQDRVARWLGGRGVWPLVRAAVVGVPLPLCSCGVVPTALGLYRSGANRAATTSFLIATPETGADSMALSWVLLGPFMMIARPVAAVISGVVTGLGVALVPGPSRECAGSGTGGDTGEAACCPGEARTAPAGCGTGLADACCTSGATTTAAPVGVAPGEQRCCPGDPAGAGAEDACCGYHASARAGNGGAACCGDAECADTRPSFRGRTWSGLRYAATDILDDISVYLLLGLVIAGLTMSLVPPTALGQWGSGPLAMAVVFVLGIPMYVCATESTPIAAAMLFAGLSPGTVLVFLLAGPSTNLGTLGALRREFGTAWLAVYLAGVAISTLGVGLLTDALVGGLHIHVAAQLGSAGQLVPSWLAATCAAVLVVLGVRPLRRALPGFRPRAA